MKMGLTKKQKTTSVFFDEDSPMIEVCTHNTDLKNRLTKCAAKFPNECRLIDNDEQGGLTFEVQQGAVWFQADTAVQRGTPQGCRRVGKNRKFKEQRKMKIVSCEFNIDTACVELQLED